MAVGEYSRASRLLERLEADGRLMELADVDAYLSALLRRLYPEQHQHFTIRVARLPGENAFALSSGVVVVHLSLLAALENEHQLAFVLAHEFEHINARHGYLGAHQRRNTRVKAHLADLVMLGSGKAYPFYADGLQQINREHELEADRRAAAVLLKAGLSVAEAARFFDVLKDYIEPSQQLQKAGTHPDNQHRKKELIKIAASNLPIHAGQSSNYRPLRQQILELSIEEKIADLDFLSALVQIDVLNSYSDEKTRIHCLEGEVYHQMALVNPEAYADIVLVKDMREHAGFDLPVVFSDASSRAYFLNRSTNEYQALEQLKPDSLCATRGLGLVYSTIGQHVQARTYLRKYLRLDPAAQDRRYVLDLLSTSAAI